MVTDMMLVSKDADLRQTPYVLASANCSIIALSTMAVFQPSSATDQLIVICAVRRRLRLRRHCLTVNAFCAPVSDVNINADATAVSNNRCVSA